MSRHALDRFGVPKGVFSERSWAVILVPLRKSGSWKKVQLPINMVKIGSYDWNRQLFTNSLPVRMREPPILRGQYCRYKALTWIVHRISYLTDSFFALKSYFLLFLLQICFSLFFTFCRVFLHNFPMKLWFFFLAQFLNFELFLGGSKLTVNCSHF